MATIASIPALASTTVTDVIPPRNFRASWTPANAHLQDTCLKKITRFFFWVINHYAKPLILNSLTKSAEEVAMVGNAFNNRWTQDSASSQFLQSRYTREPIEVTTPDGAKIRGTYFKNTSLPENARTVLCFQPNATISKSGCFDWLLKRSALYKLDSNFVIFDYRGTGESESSPNSGDDLILDGDSMYQFVSQELGVHPKFIHFYGWSLGGAVGAEVKALHSEATGNYVGERTLASIHHFTHILGGCVGSIVGAVARALISLLHWNLDGESAVRKMNGRTLVVHHPEDPVMSDGRGLYHALFQTGTLPPPPAHVVRSIDLSQGRKPHDVNQHCTPMENFETGTFHPKEDILQFLFNSNIPYAQVTRDQLLERYPPLLEEEILRVTKRLHVLTTPTPTQRMTIVHIAIEDHYIE